MNRRTFLRLSAAAAAVGGTRLAGLAGQPRQIALTFDDPTTEGGAGLTWQGINERILSTLAGHQIKAILFVCGKRIDSPAGRDLVSEWDRAGHLIANHSYSHFYFNASADTGANGSRKITLEQFESDALRNEPLIRGSRHFAPLFRYPFFKEGDTAEKRDGMRAFLADHRYRIGRATVDASDWAIAARLEQRVRLSPNADLTGYRDFFLEHIWERTRFYDSLAQRVLNQPVRHTVLLHHSPLNALFLDDLIRMFGQKEWQMVDAEYAYADPVYDRQPKILPAGESLIWALAKETGRFEKELRYPGEDDVYENPRMDARKL
jgi:peptidoglycan-N-acetylglucosamine deacetylase